MTKTQMQQQLTTPVWRSPCDGSVHLFGPLNVFEDEFDDGTFVEYGAEYMRYLLSHEVRAGSRGCRVGVRVGLWTRVPAELPLYL